MHGEDSLNRAAALHEAGQLDEAQYLYDAVLAKNADHVDALHLRALVDLARGRFVEADARLMRVAHLAPDFAPCHANRSAVLIGLAKYEHAVVCARRALDLDPVLFSAAANLVVALNRLGRSAEAVAAAGQALAAGATDIKIYTGHAEALERLGRGDEAAVSRACAKALEPSAEELIARADVLIADKKPLQAVAVCDRVLSETPNAFDALFARARALQNLGRREDAIADCDRALAVDSESAKALALRGLIFVDAKQPERALADFEGALELDPDLDLIAGESVFLSLKSCEWYGFEQKVAGLLAAVDAGKYAAQPFVLSSLASTPMQQKKAAALYFAKNNPRMGEAVARTRAFGEKLRIGYFSADLHEHPVGHLIVGLLEAHDRSQIEIIAFSFGGNADGPTRRRIAAACDQFIDALGMSDGEIARLAREKGVHIAVDLMGYTALSRPGIFAAGAAPVQVNYLGYPATMGTERYHYIIGDRFVTPPAHYEGFAECVVTMPHAYLVTNDIKRHVPARLSTRAEFGIPDAAFVFCCFNATFKITPDAFDTWMRLLGAVEGSILWLSDPGPTAKRNLRFEAKERGVDPDRLVFAPRTSGLEYLARFKVADLFLDTFHYNAHATASEALMMGLPVVTRLGEAFAGRVATSLLNAMGLPELVAADTAGYEQIALRLAREPQALRALREKLALHAATYPLFDTVRYARNLEAAYREMWSRRERGPAPDHIVVVEQA